MRTRVKICGITNAKDAAAAVESGADALGFIFYGKSPRFIEPEKAAGIINELPPFVTAVGVFVDETLDGVRKAVLASGVTCVQLHGAETPEFCDSVGGSVIKAFRIKGLEDIEAIKKYRAGAYLLDAFKTGVPGGTGKTFDWEIALEAKKLGRIILSGGLNPGNVLDAVRHVNPYAVDVSTGVEKSPGIKDPGLVRNFIEELKKA
ncbi:MAG TPA: phosphoribosylanthranilate isomerase [Thermodesulfobacteriota bacterium]|nr:phosphoribosylanthranilate isomerase [Thermodesulfobacteriota bacterium]